MGDLLIEMCHEYFGIGRLHTALAPENSAHALAPINNIQHKTGVMRPVVIDSVAQLI